MPTPQQLKQIETQMHTVDRALFERAVKDVSVVHLSVDGSGKKVKRYVLTCSIWDKDSGCPRTHLLSAFALVGGTAAAFADEIEEVLALPGIDLKKVNYLMGDLASTNQGDVGGIAALLSQKAGRPVTAAGCDLHIQNRALQNAFEFAFTVLGTNMY